MNLLLNLLMCLILFVNVSCAVSSGERIRNIAKKQNFSYQIEKSGGFSHALFSNRVHSAADGTLHVYLEGDGLPWQFRYIVSPDPTPRHPLMLKLMQQDPFPSVYVGRPCYNGFHQEDACSPSMWTIARHSRKIIKSMAEVIRRISLQRNTKELHLYGHSGGGAMAMLIAAELEHVSVVVTLAGNLDLAAWTEYHGYTPLYGSVNPATQEPLGSTVRQYHLLGEQDKNIPNELVLNWINEQSGTEYYIFRKFSHSCCWIDIWSEFLSYVSGSSPGLNIPDQQLLERDQLSQGIHLPLSYD